LIVLNYLFTIIAPFLSGQSLYNIISTKISLIDKLYRAPLILLIPNLICYFITMYLFGEHSFNFSTGGNILVLKYATLNLMITMLIVIVLIYIEKVIEVKFDVSKNE